MSPKITSGEPIGMHSSALSEAYVAPKPLFGRLAGDIGRFGIATVLAATFGAAQVFIIPRKLDVTTYGQYRLFLLYVGYLGVLHFGLADGAFLRWAGRPRTQIGSEWRTVVRWLLAIDGSLVAIAAAIGFALEPLSRTYLVALASAGLCLNVTTLAGYALQAGGDFRQASRVAVLAPGLFVVAMVALPLHSLGAVVAGYVGAYAVAATIGSLIVARIDRVTATAEMPAFRTVWRSGLAVLGANLAAGISQFADRILVSLLVPITSFAMYGFASSVMVAASAASQALSRVALSHAAWRTGAARAKFMLRFYALIAAGFGVALSGVFLFEQSVARWLPAYVPALPIVRALAIGAPFWVAIHVVLVGTLQSHGMVRRQLALELSGLSCVVAICGALLAMHATLWGVAAGATIAAVMTWSVGTAFVGRVIESFRDRATLRFVSIVGMQSAALLLANSLERGWIARTILYIALAAVPTWTAAKEARSQWPR